MITGKKSYLQYEGKEITVLNQRSRLWTHLYDCAEPKRETLFDAGCGIFSACYCGQWLTGKEFSPDQLAAFSMENGGCDNTGTNRPMLLAAMQEKGWAKEFGFEYHGDGLRNDLDTLKTHLLEHRGTSLCNLRVGHIVALVDARKVGDEVQVLALDPNSESADDRITRHVRQVIEESAIYSAITNENGLVVGERKQYAMFWINIETVRDFNLLHAIE
ncbi:MAG: hypothetical protein IKW00_06645 [Clostridia bacterium]|nr:hypothetical protein [Clostridia bacterium]